MLTRKMLVAMDISAEKIDEIINAHTETVNALKEERDGYKTQAEELESTKKELTELQKKYETLNADDSKQKLVDLQKEFDDYKQNIENEKIKEAKQNAYVEAIKKAGITTDNGIAKILKYTNLDEVEFNDGKLAKEADLVKSIQSEWKELITTTTGAKTPTPPSNTGGDTFEKMSLAEKMKYANEHPEDTGVKDWLKH